MKVILGKKIGMTRIFDGEKVIPITLIEAGPCRILQKKSAERDGYAAVQLGFEEMRKKASITKSKRQKPFRHIREFRAENIDLETGSVIDVSVFEKGDAVKVSGVSKGKGFQGGVKRHGMHGRNATHGVKHEERTIGSIGSAFPQRVIKGRKMPGRMGAERVTVQNLKIVNVDAQHHTLAIKGAIPGRRGTLLEIRG